MIMMTTHFEVSGFRHLGQSALAQALAAVEGQEYVLPLQSVSFGWLLHKISGVSVINGTGKSNMISGVSVIHTTGKASHEGKQECNSSRTTKNKCR